LKSLEIEMQRVAYGCSKLLFFYLTETQDRDFAFIVDKNYAEKQFCGIEVINPEQFAKRRAADSQVFIFAVSNGALNGIIAFLATLGFQLGQNAFLYSELFARPFSDAVRESLGWEMSSQLLQFATAFTLNSRKPVHTTLCGSWLFLEALRRATKIAGDVAEVGAFEGGNVLCALQSPVWPESKTFFVLDSFEGFPDLTNFDPAIFARCDYAPQTSLGEVLAPFAVYPQARIIKGFVPGTFAQLPPGGRYSLVFYDCDLYQPALDTFEYFWDRMGPGAVMLGHDYFAEPGGFAGVKQATTMFFDGRECRQGKFWHNTMAAFIKP
jgi:hypothetical protein